MALDGINNDAVPIPVDRDHGHSPHRGGSRRVIAATFLCSQREREILQRQLDLAHAHTKINWENVDEEESQDYGQEWDPAAEGFMAQRSRIIQTKAGMPPLGAASGMVMETTMTREHRARKIGRASCPMLSST